MTILLSPWFWLVMALGATTACGKGWIDEKASFDSYKGAVQALGASAEQHTKDQIKIDQQRKDLADAQNRDAVAALNITINKLRQSRANSNFLPPAGASSTSPDTACLSRPDFERALQQLDASVQGLITEGDQAELALTTARQWAQQK